MMKKIAAAAIIVFVWGAIFGGVWAGVDPGARDSIWIDDVAWNGDTAFVTTLYTQTDSELKQATIVLAWSSSEIQIDAVTLEGSRWQAQVDGDSGIFVATQGLVDGVPSPVHYNISFLPFGSLLPTGSGAACTIHWSRTGGTASEGTITIDSSTTTSGGGAVVNSTLFGTSADPVDNYVPAFAVGTITVLPCDCPYQADYDQDMFITSLDLAVQIDILFASHPDPEDPDCPASRTDFDCDGFPTPLDLSSMIDYLFASGSGPCDPCDCVSYPDNCP
jgi:hypothetical protein